MLDQGSVAEFGSHDSLLLNKGLYHDLWVEQIASVAARAAEDEAPQKPN